VLRINASAVHNGRPAMIVPPSSDSPAQTDWRLRASDGNAVAPVRGVVQIGSGETRLLRDPISQVGISNHSSCPSQYDSDEHREKSESP
jgi:hypothetical protein